MFHGLLLGGGWDSKYTEVVKADEMVGTVPGGIDIVAVKAPGRRPPIFADVDKYHVHPRQKDGKSIPIARYMFDAAGARLTRDQHGEEYKKPSTLDPKTKNQALVAEKYPPLWNSKTRDESKNLWGKLVIFSQKGVQLNYTNHIILSSLIDGNSYVYLIGIESPETDQIFSMGRLKIGFSAPHRTVGGIAREKKEAKGVEVPHTKSNSNAIATRLSDYRRFYGDKARIHYLLMFPDGRSAFMFETVVKELLNDYTSRSAASAGTTAGAPWFKDSNDFRLASRNASNKDRIRRVNNWNNKLIPNRASNEWYSMGEMELVMKTINETRNAFGEVMVQAGTKYPKLDPNFTKGWTQRGKEKGNARDKQSKQIVSDIVEDISGERPNADDLDESWGIATARAAIENREEEIEQEVEELEDPEDAIPAPRRSARIAALLAPVAGRGKKRKAGDDLRGNRRIEDFFEPVAMREARLAWNQAGLFGQVEPPSSSSSSRDNPPEPPEEDSETEVESDGPANPRAEMKKRLMPKRDGRNSWHCYAKGLKDRNGAKLCPDICPNFDYNILTERLYCSWCYGRDKHLLDVSAFIHMTPDQWNQWKQAGELPGTALKYFLPDVYPLWRNGYPIPDDVVLPAELLWLRTKQEEEEQKEANRDGDSKEKEARSALPSEPDPFKVTKSKGSWNDFRITEGEAVHPETEDDPQAEAQRLQRARAHVAECSPLAIQDEYDNTPYPEEPMNTFNVEWTEDNPQFQIDMNRTVLRKLVIRKAKYGLGLFARTSIPNNTVLGNYRGERMTSVEFKARYEDRGKKANYTLQVSNPKTAFVDASDPKKSNMLRFINNPKNTGFKANVRAKANGDLYTIAKVKAGSELLWNYGSDFNV